MRLFVAVPLPQELREKVALLGNEIGQDGISMVRPENMHLTLKFIGEVQALDDITGRLGRVKFSKFNCLLKGIGVFPNENYVRVVWAGGESGGALEALAKDVIGALKGYGKDERFSAHITIARVKKKIDFTEFLKRHADEEFGSFEVSRFELIESVLGSGKGPQYRTVAAFDSS
jgi:2'-5' RNA ligase